MGFRRVHPQDIRQMARCQTGNEQQCFPIPLPQAPVKDARRRFAAAVAWIRQGSCESASNATHRLHHIEEAVNRKYTNAKQKVEKSTKASVCSNASIDLHLPPVDPAETTTSSTTRRAAIAAPFKGSGEAIGSVGGCVAGALRLKTHGREPRRGIRGGLRRGARRGRRPSTL